VIQITPNEQIQKKLRSNRRKDKEEGEELHYAENNDILNPFELAALLYFYLYHSVHIHINGAKNGYK
jgi:hypothetical protein